MKTQLTASDIHGDGGYPLGALSIRIRTEHDSDHGAPWEENDGHGPVSEWTSRAKRPGERVLCSDRRLRRYYDFAAAVAEARRDGWGEVRPNETEGERAVRAVEADFKYLRDWCADKWSYLVVFVSLHSENGAELASDCIGGVESLNGYWKEQAAEMANAMLAGHATESEERAYWEEREVMTEGAQ